MKKIFITLLFISLTAFNCSTVTVVNKSKTTDAWNLNLLKIKSQGIIYLASAVYPKEKNSRFIHLFITLENKTNTNHPYDYNNVKLLNKQEKIIKTGMLYFTNTFSDKSTENFEPNKSKSIELFFEFPKDKNPDAIEFPEIGSIDFELPEK